jgi:hypothetical protein
LLDRALSVVSFAGFSEYVSVALVVPVCAILLLLFSLSLEHHQFVVKGRVRGNN